MPKRPWYRRTWVISVAALLVGTAIGSAGGSDPTTTTEYQAVAAERDQAKDDVAAAQADLQAARGELEASQAKVESIAGDLPAREAAVAEAEAAAAKAERDLAKQEAALKKAEKSVAAREKKVGIVETTIAKNTISGEGMYEAGVDIKPGTYKTSGAPGCYYAVLNSPDTFDIANNNNIDGPGVVSVSAGQYLMLSNCTDWVWQQ